jgi:RNA polymerase-binding protein DksA
MSKQNRAAEYDLLREVLLRKRDELNQDIEDRRLEIIMDLGPEDEVGVALRDACTGMTIVNMEREMRTVAEIDLTLRRMDVGAYGVCGACGDNIPLARLKAIPWARYCVDCAGGSATWPEDAESVLAESTNPSAMRQ